MAKINVSNQLSVNAHLKPDTDDGFALGTTANKWADLFMASGAVLNFNEGDVTMTHASNLLTITGGNVRVDRLELDSASDYLDVSTNLQIISAADIVLDPGGANVLPGSDSADSLGGLIADSFASSLSVSGITLSSTSKVIRFSSIPTAVLSAKDNDKVTIGSFSALLSADASATVTYASTWASSVTSDQSGGSISGVSFGSGTSAIKFSSASALTSALGNDIRKGDVVVFGDANFTITSDYSSGDSIAVTHVSGTQAGSGVSGGMTATISTAGTSDSPGGLAVDTGSGTQGSISGGTSSSISRRWSKLHVNDVDLDGNGRIDLDADADTSIRSSADDQIDFEVGGSDVMVLTDGSLVLKGTTPTVTIGDGGSEDTALVFDGASVDMYMGLDHSESKLLIGLGSAVGTTPNLELNSADRGAKFYGALEVAGNLTVNGTTTTVNSTTITVDDPIITLGGDTAPESDDNKDRGVEFRYHDGSSARIGFMGWDDSLAGFALYEAATNSSEVFSGTKSDLTVGKLLIDGTTNHIDVSTDLKITAAQDLEITANSIKPASNDGVSLGEAALGFSDLFLADGAVIGYGDGGLTLTHTETASLGSDLKSTHGPNLLSSQTFNMDLTSFAFIGLGSDIKSSHVGNITDSSLTSSSSSLTFDSATNAAAFASAIGSPGTIVRFDDGSAIYDLQFGTYSSGPSISISSVVQVLESSSLSISGVTSSGSIKVVSTSNSDAQSAAAAFASAIGEGGIVRLDDNSSPNKIDYTLAAYSVGATEVSITKAKRIDGSGAIALSTIGSSSGGGSIKKNTPIDKIAHTDSFDLSEHDGTSKGLHLAGVHMAAGAAELNAVADVSAGASHVGAVDVSADHFIFRDGGNTGASKIESFVDLAAAMAGNGLDASSGQFKISHMTDIASSASRNSILSADLATASLSAIPMALAATNITASVSVYVNGLLQTPSGSVETNQNFSAEGDDHQAAYDYEFVLDEEAGKSLVKLVNALDYDDVIQIKYFKA